MGEQEGWRGRNKTFTYSPASKGANHVPYQTDNASSIPRKPHRPSTATRISCQPFIASTQDTAEGQVEPCT